MTDENGKENIFVKNNESNKEIIEKARQGKLELPEPHTGLTWKPPIAWVKKIMKKRKF